MSGKPIVVIENNPKKAKKLEKRDIPVVFGNCTDEKVLTSAGIGNAAIAYITIPDEHDIYVCARTIKEINSECFTIVKIHTESIHQKLSREGLIDSYIWPEKHGALEAINQIICLMDTECTLWRDGNNKLK